MSNFKMNWSVIPNAMEFALTDAVSFLTDRIIKITPRDPKRPPKDPSQKVTGNLKRSIKMNKLNNTKFEIWVQKWPANKYASYLEFGTSKMKSRSFLRKWLYDNQKKVKKVMKDSLKMFINKYT